MKRKIDLDLDKIKYTGWKMAFYFKLKKVTLEEILSTLITPELEDVGWVSFGAIVEKLSGMPFNITDPDELINLATYMIEDSDNQNRVEDSTLQNTIIIKSIFRKLLGTYEGKSPYDWENCNERVENKLNQYIIIRSFLNYNRSQ